MEIEIILAIISTVFGIVSVIIRSREFRKSAQRLRQKILGLEEEAREMGIDTFPHRAPARIGFKVEKIDHLLSLLKLASSEIKRLDEDVRVKGKKVKELKELSENLESLVTLREKQAKAVRREISSALKENNRSNRIWTVIIGAIWFVLGLIVRGLLGF